MQQFDLSVWLQDKSRKVVTREGKDVEIIYTNSPVPHHPIVGFIDKSIYTWTIDGKLIYGKEEQDKNDLFFADEEEELTEFEKAVEKIIPYKIPIDMLKSTSQQLLDLARKDVLKDFPKWKKMPNRIQDNGDFNPTYLVRVSNGYHFTTPSLSWDKDSMYIELEELDKLPKEE